MKVKEEPATTASSNTSGSNDFVKKLFQMLQDENYKDIVKWTDSGDSFVVINTNDFTKDILPRHFKHSNFASFVRQLNKYDFHKVKILNEEKQHYQYQKKGSYSKENISIFHVGELPKFQRGPILCLWRACFNP